MAKKETTNKKPNGDDAKGFIVCEECREDATPHLGWWRCERCGNVRAFTRKTSSQYHEGRIGAML